MRTVNTKFVFVPHQIWNEPETYKKDHPVQFVLESDEEVARFLNTCFLKMCIQLEDDMHFKECIAYCQLDNVKCLLL